MCVREWMLDLGLDSWMDEPMVGCLDRCMDVGLVGSTNSWMFGLMLNEGLDGC